MTQLDTHTDRDDRLAGTLIDGRYRIERAVGASRDVTVYAATHVGLGSRVTLEVLRLPAALPAGELAAHAEAFVAEGRALTCLHHPGILAALDAALLPADEAGRRLPYLVREWCDGPTLEATLAARHGQPMPLDEAWRIFAPLLDAMAHAHALGVVHGDLGPAHVILDGMARAPRLAGFGTIRARAKDPRADVHALALIFVALVTGGRAVNDPARPTAGVAGALDPVLARALAPSSLDRHADAAALADAMRAALASPPPDRAEGPLARTLRAGMIAVAIVSIATLALVAARHLLVPRLRDLTGAEIDHRAREANLGGCATTSTADMTSVGCARGAVLFTLVGLAGTTPEAARMNADSTAAAYLPAYGAARVAIDGGKMLIVAARPEALQKAFDTVLGSSAVEQEHDVTELKAPARSPASAHGLARWSGADLWAAAARPGWHVGYANSAMNPATVVITGEPARSAALTLYIGSSREKLEAIKHAGAAPFGYALDGDRLLLSMGTSTVVTAAFVRELLGGAPAAEIGEYVPGK